MQLKQPGIGLLEAIIVLGIVVFLTSMIVSLARQDSTTTDLKKIEHAVSGMLTTARQEVLVTHNVMRLHIKADRGSAQSLTLEYAAQNNEPNEPIKFIPARTIGGTNSFTIPSTWKITAIYQGADDLLNTTKKGLQSVFCYVMPGGIIPALLIHLRATQKQQVATLRTEPFQKTITLYPTLLAPPKKIRK